MKRLFRHMLAGESGASLIEYVLLLAFIAATVAEMLATFGTTVSASLNDSAGQMPY